MKLNLGMLLFCAMNFAHGETLTQQSYDQQIKHYTEIIQQTKSILDEPNSKADAKMQSQAFCDRLDAYEQIAKLSRENANLELASIMLMASESYLNRQQDSLSGSGMTSAVFCAGKIKQ